MNTVFFLFCIVYPASFDSVGQPCCPSKQQGDYEVPQWNYSYGETIGVNDSVHAEIERTFRLISQKQTRQAWAPAVMNFSGEGGN